MILAELNKLLLNVARSSYLVNDAFIGDVYTINGKENKFGCFVATPMSAVKESGTIRYTYYMYYIDRLTKAEDNIDFVQSDAVSMLKGLLDYIEGQGVEIESGYEFTLFRQQFSDWCAGAYVNVSILVADNDCQEGGFNAGGYSLIDLTVDRNGIYTPPSGYDGYGRIVVNVPVNGATEEWVDEEIDLKLTGYATESWVQSQHYLTQHQDISGKADKSYVDSAITAAINGLGIDDYATRAWVTGQDFLKDEDLSGYATQAWTNSQGFLKSAALDGLATEQWVRNQNYLPGTALTGYATEQWVRNQGYVTGIQLDDYATRDWINTQDFLVQDDLCGLATEQWVQNWVTAQDYLQECDLEGYATENWVLDQGFATEDWVSQNYASKSWVNNILTDYATKDWVNDTIDTRLTGYATQNWVSDNFIDTTEIQSYATRTWVSDNFVDNTTIQDYATRSWVSQNYVDNTTIQDYAQKDWVSQNYIDTTEIQDYATRSWVENNYVDNTAIQNYVSIEDLDQDLEGYATEQWVNEQGFIKDISQYIWRGYIDEWDELTPEEQCSYLIAMIIE